MARGLLLAPQGGILPLQGALAVEEYAALSAHPADVPAKEQAGQTLSVVSHADDEAAPVHLGLAAATGT